MDRQILKLSVMVRTKNKELLHTMDGDHCAAVLEVTTAHCNCFMAELITQASFAFLKPFQILSICRQWLTSVGKHE